MRKPPRAEEDDAGPRVVDDRADGAEAPHVTVALVEEEGAVSFATDAGEGVAAAVAEKLACFPGAFPLLHPFKAVVDDQGAASLPSVARWR